MTILRSHRLLGRALLAAACAVPVLCGDTVLAQEAPDGARGLGGDSSFTELRRVVRRGSDEDAAFVDGLRALEVEVLRFDALASQSYKQRGYFDALGVGTDEPLAAFHTALRAFLLDPLPVFDAGRKKDRPALAELFFDTRARVRRAVFEDAERDTYDVRAGLTLLAANDDGLVRQTEPEARIVARRIDIAAAFQRARIKDLDALREFGATSEVLEEDVERLLTILSTTKAKEREARVLAELDAVDRRAQAMGDVLFTERLRRTAAESLRWRDDARAKAAKLADEIRLWRPDTDEGKAAPRNVSSISKTKRRAQAYARALSAAAIDPLNEEVTLAVAQLTEYLDSIHATADWSDRYLALRGIRAHDDRNWRERELTKEEEHALYVVQSYSPEGAPAPGGHVGKPGEPPIGSGGTTGTPVGGGDDG